HVRFLEPGDREILVAVPSTESVRAVTPGSGVALPRAVGVESGAAAGDRHATADGPPAERSVIEIRAEEDVRVRTAAAGADGFHCRGGRGPEPPDHEDREHDPKQEPAASLRSHAPMPPPMARPRVVVAAVPCSTREKPATNMPGNLSRRGVAAEEGQ